LSRAARGRAPPRPPPSPPPPPPPRPQIEPKGELVLVRINESEEQTKSGIILPDSVRQKPTAGTVVAAGDGRRPGRCDYRMTLKEGDVVLYGRFGIGCVDVTLDGIDYVLLREDDVLGTFPPGSAAGADDIPSLRPLCDRVLVRCDVVADETGGGVLLTSADKEKPLAGTVVAAGPGRQAAEDALERSLALQRGDDPSGVMPVAEGDRVVYFKFAGDDLVTPDGTKYVLLRGNDVLAKLN